MQQNVLHSPAKSLTDANVFLPGSGFLADYSSKCFLGNYSIHCVHLQSTEEVHSRVEGFAKETDLLKN